MKILLVTLQGANYGNRLQNYALQSVLKAKGYEIDTPYYTPEQYYTIKKKIKHLIKIFLGVIGIKKYKEELSKVKKERLFKLFDEKFIDNKFFVRFGNVSNIDNSKYCCAIVGSDQVWHNWTKTDKELDFFYLKFMTPGKRIAYAASFGFPDFSRDIEIHRDGLSNIDFLSVREKNGYEIIKRKYGISSEIVPDPTILLTKEEWKCFEQKPIFEINDKFAVVYFLGEKTEKAKSMIEQLINSNIQIIDLMDFMGPYYLSTPNNFVWLVRNSKYVLTDSFHACVFSIMFEKKFIAFERKDKYVTNMFDRIVNLLDATNNMQYLEKNIKDLDTLDSLNLVNSENELEDYRKKGILFLDDALSKVV